MKAIRFIAAALLCANVVYADANEFAKAKEQGTKALIKYGQKLEKAKKYNDAICVYQTIISSEKDAANVQEALIKSAKAKVKLNDFGVPGESHGERSLVGYSPWFLRVGHD